MITSETLFAMIDEMGSIHKEAAAVAMNPYLNTKVKLQKLQKVDTRGPAITKSINSNLRKRRKVTNVNPLNPQNP